MTPEQFDHDFEIVSRVEYVGPPTPQRRFSYDNVLYVRPRTGGVPPMTGVFYPCCNQWHPSPASHRTGPRGECVMAALRKPIEKRPAISPAPAQMGWYVR